MYRVIAGLHIASAMGIAEMMALPNEPQLYIMLTTCVTVMGSVALQLLNARQENRRREGERIERKEHRDEARRASEESKAEIIASAAIQARLIREGLESNTDLTLQGIRQTQEFARVANHVNEKIANIAARVVAGTAAVPAIQEIVHEIVQDTNETVHRIEDKA